MKMVFSLRLALCFCVRPFSCGKAALKIAYLWCSVVGVLLSPLAYADQFTAKVIEVFDGDTVLVLRGAQKIKIRLANIDAPEVGHAGVSGQPPSSHMAQEGGMASMQALMGMVLHKQIQVDSQTTDQYGRMVATLHVDGKNVNEEQVRNGMAWEYSGYHSNKTYIALQSEAQQARRGLWAQPNPMPPWQWRKAHPTTLPAAPAVTSAPVAGAYTCGSKRHCAQMISCAEARFYLTQCGVKTLDRNRDGVPCESLCAPKK